MIRKKNLLVVAVAALLTAVAVEGVGVWVARVDAPLIYEKKVAYVETLEATNVTESSADLEGELAHLRGYDEVNVSFEYREQNETNPDQWNKTVDQLYTSSGRFNETIEGLTANTTYEYRAIVENNTERLDEGNIIEFITLESVEGISSWYELSAVRNDMSADYTLGTDLDKTSDGYDELVDTNQGWNPIGTQDVRFTGSFDGGNNSISDLYIDRPTEDNQGIFGHVGDNVGETTIKDVCVRDANVTGDRAVGTLIGRVTGNQDTLINRSCAVNSSVEGTGAVGGLIGSFNSYRETSGGTDNPVLSQSFADVDVSDQEGTASPDKFGGLIGCSQKGTIRNSYALGNVTVRNSGERIGGLAGCIDYRGEIENSYSTGNVTAPGSDPVGGLVGNIEGKGGSSGKVIFSYSNNETSNQTDLVGAVGDGDVTGGMRTTDDMIWTYSNDVYEGWDMAQDGSEIWLSGDHEIVEDREGNTGYPALQWQNV